MIRQKYIRYAVKGFVIFRDTDSMVHFDVDRAIGNKFDRVLSAGFVELGNGIVRCYGRSESMNKDSRLDDSIALANQIGITITGESL